MSDGAEPFDSDFYDRFDAALGVVLAGSVALAEQAEEDAGDICAAIVTALVIRAFEIAVETMDAARAVDLIHSIGQRVAMETEALAKCGKKARLDA